MAAQRNYTRDLWNISDYTQDCIALDETVPLQQMDYQDCKYEMIPVADLEGGGGVGGRNPPVGIHFFFFFFLFNFNSTVHPTPQPPFTTSLECQPPPPVGAELDLPLDSSIRSRDTVTDGDVVLLTNIGITGIVVNCGTRLEEAYQLGHVHSYRPNLVRSYSGAVPEDRGGGRPGCS